MISVDICVHGYCIRSEQTGIAGEIRDSIEGVFETMGASEE